MFLSEQRLINKILSNPSRNESDANSIKTLQAIQTAISFVYIKYLIFVIAAGAFFSYLVVYLNNAHHLIQTGIWSLVGIVTCAILFFVCQQLAAFSGNDVPIKRMFITMLVCACILGSYVGVGTAITLHFHGLPSHSLNYAQAGYLFFFVIVSMVALGTLSSRREYIFAFLITSNAGLIYALTQHHFELLSPPYLYLYFFCFIGFLLILGYEEYSHRARIYTLYVNHQDALDEVATQKELSEISKIQLENEIIQRASAEESLSQQNKKLEQTIAERTEHLSQVNANLIRTKNSMDMAYLAAGMASWDWDLEKQTLTGRNFENLLGYSTERIRELSFDVYPILHPEDADIFRDHMHDIVQNQQKSLDMKIRAKNVHDEWLWIEFKGICVSADSRTQDVKRMVGVCRDITIDQNIADSLALSNSVFEQSIEAIFVLNNQFEYISINPSFERVTGFTQDEVKGHHLFDNQHQRESAHYQEILGTLEDTGEFSGDITQQNKSGSRIFLNVSINAVYNDDNQVVNYIGIFSDITQQTADRQRMSYLANYDQLTDLPNRAFFNQQLHTLLAEKDTKFAVVRINIDRFRILNSSLGSKQADLLLQLVSQRLSSLDHPIRALSRLAGDDFAVLYSHLSLRNLKDYIDSILESFKQPFYIANQEIAVSLSIGMSLYPQHGHQVDTLMNRAEQGLKRAKLNGGSDYFIYNQGLQVSSLDNLQLENELRRAISHGELVLFYQPKVDLQTGSLVGFEALVRWHHETKGLLLPGEFIELATETGLINDLTIDVLSQTCHQIKKWQDYGLPDITVAVNIEAKQLQRGNFLSILDNVIHSSQIDSQSLEIEITESSLIDMPEKIKPLLASIKSRNISISLDDFGTGYSSLAYLSQYPIDVIKIDRSFIRDISTNTQSAAIARAIIAMGHALDITLVAEGIENIQQRDFLLAEGCQIGQGYYYGKPVPVAAATKLLQQQQKNKAVFSTLAADAIPVSHKIQ